MPTFDVRTRRYAGLALAAATAVGAVSINGVAASAAPGLPPVGTNLIMNGNFYKPNATLHEGGTPKDWTPVNLGVESDPYDATIGVYNAKGKYPPPKGNPDPKDVAVEDFYEAGSSIGIEGFGGEQTSATFGSITQANNAKVKFSNVEHSAPEASVANWAGSGLEVDFTSGGTSYSLIYYNQWTAYESTFPGQPTNTNTTKYILGPTLTADTWNTQKARSLNKDIDSQFGFTSFTVNDVIFINLEDTTSSASPYPNMDGYVADVAVTEGKS